MNNPKMSARKEREQRLRGVLNEISELGRQIMLRNDPEMAAGDRHDISRIATLSAIALTSDGDEKHE